MITGEEMIGYCPMCKREFELPDDVAGRNVRCCYCKEKFLADEAYISKQA